MKCAKNVITKNNLLCGEIANIIFDEYAVL